MTAPAGTHADRPVMPASYGLRPARGNGDLLPWSEVEARLRDARTYWLATGRPDGRPHAMPVWGIWRDGRLWFGTDRRSRKARNLLANPLVAVHLPSGEDVVILEGVAEAGADPALTGPVDDAYLAKYGLRLGDHPGEVVLWSVRPRVAFAWQERDFTATATRWRLGETP